jgi:hypothetical protein
MYRRVEDTMLMISWVQIPAISEFGIRGSLCRLCQLPADKRQSAHTRYRQCLSAVDEFCNSSQSRRKKYRQLCALVSRGVPVSAGVPVPAAEPVSAYDLHLAHLRRRTIGCRWRAWGAQESPTGGKTKNMQMRIIKA